MAYKVSFGLQKGGTGKSTSVINTAYILSTLGKKVAVVDFDNQGNLSLSLGVDPDDLKHTIYDAILGKCELNNIRFRKSGFDVYPSNDNLSRLDMVIINNRDDFPNAGHVLKNLLQQLDHKYDYILIDLPPSLGLLTINGLTASDGLIIPLQTEYFALSGLRRMIATVEDIIVPDFNSDLEILGILPTMFDKRLNLNMSVLQNVRRNFADNSKYKIFDSTISRTTKFGLAPIKGKPAVELYKDDPAVQEYRSFVKEAFGL